MSSKMSRRNFLKTTGIVAAGLTAGGLSFPTPIQALASRRRQGASTIQFWSQPYGDQVLYQELLANLATQFQEESGIGVTSELINWSVAGQTWLTVAQGGAHPDAADMYWLYSNAAIGGGQYGPRPITEFKDQYFPDLEARFFTNALLDVTWQGEFYGVPWRGDIRPLAYRTDIAAEVGIERAPDNWDEITEFARELTLRDGADVVRYGFAFGTAVPIQALLPYYWSAGGRLMDAEGRTATIDNEAMRETLRWMYDLIWTHQVVAPDFMEQGYNPAEQFVAGSVAMIGSVVDTFPAGWERDFPDLQWALAIPPMGPDNRSAYSGAGYWGVLNGSQAVEESVQWIAFLSRDENMQRLTEFIGRPSPLISVMNSAFWQDRPWKQVLVETLQYAVPSQQPSPVWTTLIAGAPGAVLYDMFYDSLVRQVDIDEAVTTAQARMQEEMDKVVTPA
jgi:multiple sugar transport system substrate-binding protein